MNGIIYLNPQTMRANLTDDEGGMPYVPVSKCVEQDRTIDFAVDMIKSFAEQGSIDRIHAKMYKRMFACSVLFGATIISNFVSGCFDTWFNITIGVIWTIIVSGVWFNGEMKIFEIESVGIQCNDDITSEIKDALNKRNRRPFEKNNK